MDPARTIDEHPNFKYYNGHTDKEMHNLNQILLPKQMYKMMREHTGLRSWHHYTAGGRDRRIGALPPAVITGEAYGSVRPVELGYERFSQYFLRRDECQ